MAQEQDTIIEEVGTESGLYTPLVTERNQIRLLDLTQSLWSNDLQGTLRTVSLDSNPSYEALSYTWGQPSESDKRFCINSRHHETIRDKSICTTSRHHVKIRDNLYNALWRLRRQFTRRTLWVDAICINQDDENGEKNSQVPMMGRIYENAITVLIWLGDSPDATFSDALKMRRPHFTKTSHGVVRNAHGRRYAITMDDAIRRTESKWHERAWVIQEFAMAREVLLCFGSVSVPFDPVHIVDLVMGSPEPLSYLRAFHFAISDMVKLKLGLGGKRQSISEAILYTSTASCSNPRDKVYSLLSMIDPREARLIQTNYEEPCQRTYAKATFAAIVAQNDVSILELISLHQPRMNDLPTWAVDFTVEQIPTNGRIHQMMDDRAAWAKREIATKDSITIDPALQHLTTHGVYFDSVRSILRLPSFAPNEAGVKVAEVVAPFLEDTFVSLRSDHASSGLEYTPVPNVKCSSLLVRGPSTQVSDVFRTTFVLWNKVTGFPSCHNEQDSRWKPSHKAVRLRAIAGSSISSDGLLQALHSNLADYLPVYIEYSKFVGGDCVVFATSHGFIGLAPSSVVVGDSIVLIHGSRYPLLLRRIGEAHTFQGLAYVHGIMEGELVDAWSGCDIDEMDFIIR